MNVLRCLADEIEDHLDKSVVKDTVEYWQVERAESLMWLWILGAYEVVRTITQAKSCFADEFLERLALLKKDLTSVRMPVAKMEKPGKKRPVSSPALWLCGSVALWLESENDLLLGDPETDTHPRARKLLEKFTTAFASLKAEDVLSRHEDSYAKM